MCVNASALPADLSSYLELSSSSTSPLLAEMKVTWTTQWRPLNQASQTDGRRDQSKDEHTTCKLSASINYKAGQWESREGKVHLTLVLNESPPLAALLVIRGDKFASRSTPPTATVNISHEMHIGRRGEDFPQDLTEAHFQRWVYEFSVKHNFMIISILRVNRPMGGQ